MSLRSFMALVAILGIAASLIALAVPLPSGEPEATMTPSQCSAMCIETSVWVWRPDRCECAP